MNKIGFPITTPGWNGIREHYKAIQEHGVNMVPKHGMWNVHKPEECKLPESKGKFPRITKMVTTSGY